MGDVIWIPVVFTAMLFVLIAYFINEENAKYLLAGYNTMSEEARSKFDIVGYLKFFKRFFYQLAGFSTLIFCGAYLLWGERDAVIIWTIAITLPLFYLLYKGQQFKKK